LKPYELNVSSPKANNGRREGRNSLSAATVYQTDDFPLDLRESGKQFMGASLTR